MGDFVESKLTGDVTKALNRLLNEDAEALLRAAGFAGAKIIKDEAVRRVPVKSGTIRKNIIVKRMEEKSDGGKKQTYKVTVRTGKHGNEGDAYYWRWVEEGHSYVRKKPSKTSKAMTWKAHRAAMKLEYGDSKKGARPFMRPAYEAVKGQIIDAMRERMAEKLKELLAKT